MKKTDLMSVDGRQLAMLISIYENRSVSAAAVAFDMTQSSVSHTLEKLRACLGDPLFVRSGRTLEATERAHEIIPLAREIVAQYDALMNAQAYDPRADETPFTFAINITEFMPEIVKIRDALRLEAPSARIRFLELGSREMVEGLLVRSVADLALTVRIPTYPPFLNHVSVAKDHFACFYDASSRGPILTVEDFCRAEHGVLDFGGRRKSTIETELDKLSMSRTVTIAASSVVGMGELIRGISTIMTMQSRLGASALSHLSMSPPPIPLPECHFDMVWHRRSEESGRNKWLRRLVTEVFSETTEAPRSA